MSADADVRSFVLEALADLGAVVSEGDGLTWVQAPETLQHALEVPANFALTFEPRPERDFEAELVARGSYFLERLVSLMTCRGRWDGARFEDPGGDWVASAFSASGLGIETGVRFQIERVDEETLFLFSFRLTLVADEKRESLHFIAVSPDDTVAWAVDGPPPDSGSNPNRGSGPPANLETSYGLAVEALRRRTLEEVARFRSRSLGLLEEEVRRIFGYFDKTLEEIRATNPEGSTDLLKAVMVERDRRLTEALERFDPKARASLCAIRAMLVPVARVRADLPDGPGAILKVDAWSRFLRGLVCGACHGTDGPWDATRAGSLQCATCAATRGASSPPRGRPRSDTPQRGTRAGGASARFPRGSTGRSRAASARRRSP